ncbi:MAG TPA: hypothetical protein VMN77_01980 [Nitrospiria bacterium]|nr:hypothetical protein [Nitrospiria bacterium]
MTMISRKTQIRRTALVLAAGYLFLSGFMSFGAVQQGVHPMRHAGHAKQHSTPFCHWMCSASTFVHSADFNVNQDVHPSFEKLPIRTESFFSSLSVFHVYIRPPPVVLV